ncbi:acyl-CoA dehydrogenase [Nevskia sp.]|uniref:acyl-CoA dehydrogenase n=1 Tax=Nevskia sp. TaxID=1929292 RepID=UPI0025F8F829|nr:acyl-CoA dehydrogenase [Nevskia sp.]
MSPLINRRDLSFLLYELLDVEALCARSRYAMHDRDSYEAVIDAAHRLAVEQFLPHAAKADAHEPSFDGHTVTLIPEVKAALAAYVDGGFLSASFDAELGGLQLPYTIASAVNGLFVGANCGTAAYPFLTTAAANLLRVHGSPEQKARYLQPMLAGRYFGTMCLSEPQAGSSLADIRTRAMPEADGRYRISGNKMWISGGEHELADNIVHLLLARIDGAPAGTRGISLFIVPKYRLDADGNPGPRNGVNLASLNHKMGYRGTTNCALNFGDVDGEPCYGELVGRANEGLACMFHMMNEARIGVGLGATMLGYAGYRYSLDYAKTRLQGRLASNRDPASKPVAIIEHSDVRRMLLAQKAYVEGGLALGLYCASLIDEQATAETAEARAEAGLLLDILTPIAKAWPSEWCLEANKLAIQVLGGYGYTRDYPVERLYRDNRLNPIHEGTNGIQALDLLGRKALMNNGAALKLLLSRIVATAQAAGEITALAEHAQALAAAVARIAGTTQRLAAVAQRGETELFLANASSYLDLVGHTVIAWLWLRQACVAQLALASASAADAAFYTGKLQTCRWFFRHELPKTLTQAALLDSLDDTVLTMDLAGF